ncbi:MAG: cell division protein ZapA [Muribaculaceae bacterium]|nr:cell division protein ZapA [Muribaculaceae bacterium]
MKSKETKINIDVNIYGTRFSVSVPFSEQDAVRATESEMKAYLKHLRDAHSRKSLPECLAMMAYHYAAEFFALRALHDAEASEAEDLLSDTERLLGEHDGEEPDNDRREFGEF